MRVYLDEDISPRVAENARGRCGIDAISAYEIGALGWHDDVQLRYAAEQGRCLVTPNRDDFIAETLAAFEAGRPHAGLLIVPYSLPNKQPNAIAAALCAYAARFPDRLRAYTIDFLTLAG